MRGRDLLKEIVQTHTVACHCYHKRMHYDLEKALEADRGSPECFNLKCHRLILIHHGTVAQQRLLNLFEMLPTYIVLTIHGLAE